MRDKIALEQMLLKNLEDKVLWNVYADLLEEAGTNDKIVKLTREMHSALHLEEADLLDLLRVAFGTKTLLRVTRKKRAWLAKRVLEQYSFLEGKLTKWLKVLFPRISLIELQNWFPLALGEFEEDLESHQINYTLGSPHFELNHPSEQVVTAIIFRDYPFSVDVFDLGNDEYNKQEQNRLGDYLESKLFSEVVVLLRRTEDDDTFEEEEGEYWHPY